jgi:very-short-patch-repair endonuclease
MSTTQEAEYDEGFLHNAGFTTVQHLPNDTIKTYMIGRMRSQEDDDYRGMFLNCHAISTPDTGEKDNFAFFCSKDRAIKTYFDGVWYVGPFRLEYVLGGGHSYGHIEESAIGLEFSSDLRRMVADYCFRAVNLADIVLAEIDRDSYGSLVELGWAQQAGKPIYLLIKPDDELWFASQTTLLRSCNFVTSNVDEFRQAVKLAFNNQPTWRDLLRRRRPNSTPPEILFAEAYADLADQFAPILVQQYKIPGTNYRVDFACLERKAIIEVDGFTYHSTRPQFNHDRKRQRQLEMLGWRMLRFTADEVAQSEICVYDTISWLNRL